MRLWFFLFGVLALSALAGCSPAGLAVGAASGAAVSLSKEKPVDEQLDDLGIDVAIQKAWLEEEAVRNLRSQGAQVVSCLRAAMSRQEAVGERAEK